MSTILYVVANTTTLTAGETFIENRLTATLGHTVTRRSQVSAAPVPVTQDIVVISCAAVTLTATIYNNCGKPVLSFGAKPHSLYTSGGLASQTGVASYYLWSVASSPWLTGITGLPGTKTMFSASTGAGGLLYALDTTYGTDFKKVASVDSGVTYGQHRVVAGYYNTGDLLSDGITVCPSPRGRIELVDADAAALSGTGLTLFDNAVAWAIAGTVANTAPTAVATLSPTAATTGATVTFTGTGSSDPDGTIASYSWSWGDGTANGSGSVATHAYTTSGTKTWVLTVTDNLGATGTATGTIVISAPTGPTASATVSPATPTLGTTTTFNGNGSTAASGSTIVGYVWAFGDGTPNATGAVVTHTYTAAGAKTWTLTVTDSLGATNTTTGSFTIAANAPPVAVATISPTSAATGAVVTFTGSSSTDSDGTISTYAWNYGDGSQDAFGSVTTHVYTTVGTKNWTLTVTDNNGAQDLFAGSIVISAGALYNAARLVRISSAWVDAQAIRMA